MTPTQIFNDFERFNNNKKIRVGGLVVKDSIVKKSDSMEFDISDIDHNLHIIFTGNEIPPIFRENVGVIARGYLINHNTFIAQQLIGKHDENYMPPKNK